MADDIVTRLRAAARSGDLPLGASFDCDGVADEIERLRVAGDLLAAYVVLNVPPTATCFAAVERWREARRA